MAFENNWFVVCLSPYWGRFDRTHCLSPSIVTLAGTNIVKGKTLSQLSQFSITLHVRRPYWDGFQSHEYARKLSFENLILRESPRVK